MEKKIESFIDYLIYQKSYSSYTAKNYEIDLKSYQEYLERECINYLKIEYSDIRFYLMYLKEEKKEKNSSICRNLSALRTFYNYLINKNIIDKNPFSYISGPKKDQTQS